MFWAIRADHWCCSAKCRFQWHKNNNTGFGKVKHLFEKHLKELEERIERIEKGII